MLAFLEGEPTRLPYRVVRHVVAATYGTSPARVDRWPADDVLEAVKLLPMTRLVTFGGRRE